MTVLSLLTEEPLEPEPEQKYFPVAFFHGYEVYAGGRLGPLSQAVCEAGLSLLRTNGELKAILLGGWHLKEAGEITIADAMQAFLMRKGIDPERIITKRRLHSLEGVMPARDSWEELVLLKRMLSRLGISTGAPLTSVAWDFHIRRLTKMYATYGFTDVVAAPAIPEPHEGLSRRKRMERAARIVRFIDPDGDGIICHNTRLGRTLKEDGLQPLIP